MWMRSCAVCKALLQKCSLRDSVRCQCGWEWQGYTNEHVNQLADPEGRMERGLA